MSEHIEERFNENLEAVVKLVENENYDGAYSVLKECEKMIRKNDMERPQRYIELKEEVFDNKKRDFIDQSERYLDNGEYLRSKIILEKLYKEMEDINKPLENELIDLEYRINETAIEENLFGALEALEEDDLYGVKDGLIRSMKYCYKLHKLMKFSEITNMGKSE